MAYSRLFVGFSTAPGAPASNKLYDLDLVRQDLINAFYTRQGERLMRPDFGSIIWDLVMEPFTETIQNAIVANAVQIVNNDSRLNLININVTPYTQGIRIEMQIEYLPYNVIQTFQLDFDARQDVSPLTD